MDQEQPPPVVPYATPSKSLPPKFRLHVVSAALAILAMAGHTLGGYARGMRARNLWEGVGEGIGTGLAIILIAYLLSWLLYRLQRSNLAANVLFCVVNLRPIPS